MLPKKAPKIVFPDNHAIYVKALYKSILAEGSLFFDDRARTFIQNRTRYLFKEYKDCADLERVKSKIKEARRKLHKLEEANRGNFRKAYKILLDVYGRRGKVRHSLLYPYLNQFKPVDFKHPEPFIPHVPRTAPPPPLCPPLRVLITDHLGKRLSPILPEPKHKPLHVGRKANLLWRHHSNLLSRVSVPLPFEILCELETKAGALPNHPMSAASLGKGGPKWDQFYFAYQNNFDLAHLSPHLKSHVPQSKVVRSQTVAGIRSPYETVKMPNILEYLEEKESKKPELQKYESPYDNRQTRRLYRRLLNEIPCMDMFTWETLWKEGVNYTIFKSNWIPKGVRELIPETLSSEVIKETMKTNKRKK
ncbi:hypothetical protein BCV72DRAFT_222289 [Rhizopus microsporus var. microsporus]|uniref:LYR motif-containing protein Cup1-like N-terminal domain-containing protein n=2 Tax=Rhizopus microsporus TaxID=58291 RepID=A0A2G4T2G2_RHIZD|nr:uncharacterized protein RHIMIDRAFT_271710 [Rhizopus microsporus ATCC 52813]ORE09996.1 hypothetical protein BCV72DRAFT_222289 [Rhizopus microsporus var. microsporus]PHZ15202.1 hypothetical protein RHIMIDRAFT_271710 [Rhizopus microsporus ATCC 52813]